jgi:CheY-like chemotaxis protein
MKMKKPSYKYRGILLVDDSELDNFINQKIVEASSFSEKIYVNTSAMGALEFMQNLEVAGRGGVYPEVIFVDLNMPIMDGFQFITALRQLPAFRNHQAKLVILTSSVSPKDRLTAAEMGGGIVFLNKPLTREMLDFI